MAKEKSQIGFALKRINTEQFAIIESSYEEEIDVDLKAGLKFGIDFEGSTISVVFSTSFVQEKSPFLIIVAACYFHISEDAWNSFYNKSKTELTVEKNFISHLTMLTIGTTRGILHNKTEGTRFNSFFIPTLNVSELVRKDVIFKIESAQK